METIHSNKRYYEKNKLTMVDMFKSENANKAYFEKGKLDNANVLGRDKAKKAIREYLTNNRAELGKSTIVICYVTDRGLKYVDLQNVGDELTDSMINRSLMVDPVTNKKYEELNSSSITGATIYGVRIMHMKSPEIKPGTEPKPAVKKKRKMPSKTSIPPRLKLD